MDGGNRWTGTHGWAAGGAQDKTLINRIMLRFRPIAPKPVSGGSVADPKGEIVGKQRSKRKYVRVNKNRKSKVTKEEAKRDLDFNGVGAVVTFQTSPRDVKISPEIMSFELHHQPGWMSLTKESRSEEKSDRSGTGPSMRMVESWLVVNGLSETLLDVGGLGSTDMEKMRNLEVDTCPGLISDDQNRVQWVNLAYKRMVDEDGSSDEGQAMEVVVWLVVKENIPVVWPVFACTARVVYRKSSRNERQSQTMPCDVWKMDFGGFAWRLDSAAALSLGR